MNSLLLALVLILLLVVAAAVGSICGGWGRVRTVVLSQKRTSSAAHYSECTYVSTKGIAYMACDVYPDTIVADTTEMNLAEYTHIRDGDVVYVVSTCLHVFADSILPRLESAGTRIKLVTGSSDSGVPQEIGNRHRVNYMQRFFERSKCILRWYTQNCDAQHPLIVPIPIGLDYHTLSDNTNHAWGTRSTPQEQDRMLQSIYANSTPFNDRLHKSYSFYHFRTYPDRHGNDRKLATDALSHRKDNVFASQPQGRQETWKQCAKYKCIIVIEHTKPCALGVYP